MSIISALQTYIKTFPSLETGRMVFVDYLGVTYDTEYSITPLPGTRIIEETITGIKTMEYPFAFMTKVLTADDLERVGNNGFQETFATWLDTQTLAGTFPTLEAGKTPEKIEAVSWGYLFEQGESQSGIYRIECKLTYAQGA
jgi:hypothetical protein